MSLKQVLIINEIPTAGLELFKNKVNYAIVPGKDCFPEKMDEIKKQMKSIDGLIWNTKHRLTKDLLDLAGPQLKAVTTMSSGTDQVDVEEVKRRGLPLGNTPKVLDDAVADITVGLLIAAARRFKEGIRDMESGAWKFGVNWTLGQDIAGSTVGVVGLGGIGQAVVRRLAGFGVAKFLYSGRTDKPEAQQLGAQRVSQEDLLSRSDFIILACPLTSESRNLINRASIDTMKRNAIIVNIARGGLIDQEALYEALQSGRIFAAGLDVMTPEPIPKDHPLLTLPNCYIIPHMGSSTFETRNAMAQISATNILLALEGKTMQCRV